MHYCLSDRPPTIAVQHEAAAYRVEINACPTNKPILKISIPISSAPSPAPALNSHEVLQDADKTSL
jgi:hypothetical protein